MFLCNQIVNTLYYYPISYLLEDLSKELSKLPNVRKVVISKHIKSSREVSLLIIADITPRERIDLLTEAISLCVKTERKLDKLTKSVNWNLQVSVPWTKN